MAAKLHVNPLVAAKSLANPLADVKLQLRAVARKKACWPNCSAARRAADVTRAATLSPLADAKSLANQLVAAKLLHPLAVAKLLLPATAAAARGSRSAC